MQPSKPLPQSLTDLCFPEQLTLWSIRYWADACRKDHSPYGVLKDAYKLASCSDSLLSLDSFMTLLISGNSRSVDIRCLCCGGISLDEWRILQSLALVQQGDKRVIARLISHFLEPSTTRMALPLIHEWAFNLRAGNHIIPIRSNALTAGQHYHPSSQESAPKAQSALLDHHALH